MITERLKADYASLEALVNLNPKYLTLVDHAPDLRRFTLSARFDAPIAKEEGYVIADQHSLSVEIPDNYLRRDAAGLFVKSRIRREGERVFHPNCWPSDGYLCYDSQFHPGKSLAEQVWTACRLMQCQLVNHGSPADWEADFHFLQAGDQIRAKIRPVELLLPRPTPRIAAPALPSVRAA